MAIQGTQVPMYTKHILFLYFSEFSIFFLIFIWKIKWTTLKNEQQKHVKQSNKTRLTQKKNKALKLCKTNTRRERRNDRITWIPFPSTPWKSLSFEQTLEPVVRGKNRNRSSLKGIWGLWEDLQKEQEMIEADSGSQMLSCSCFVEWLVTYSNLIKYDRQYHNDDRDATFFV